MQKKILASMILIMATALLFSMENQVLTNADVFSHDSISSGSLQLHFTTPEWTEETIESGNGAFSKIEIAERDIPFVTAEEGLPELPFFSTMIAVPNTGSVQLEQLSMVEDRSAIPPVYPYQNEVSNRSSALTLNDAFYQGDSVYPEEAVVVGQPVIMRNLRMVPVNIFPYAYDAASHELIVREDISFTINTINSQAVNEIHNERPLSRSFEPLYRSVLLNYDDIRDEEPAYQNPSILMVQCNNTAIDDQVQQLANWKRNKGFEVTIVSTGDIGTSNTSIKAYIQDAYNTWENPPEYVILIGDVGGSYDVATYYGASNGEGDHPYACLDGNDILPELFVGRLTIGDATDMMTILSKIVKYERTPYTGDTDWYHHSLLVGDTSPSGLSCEITSKYVKEDILSYDPTHTFTEMYSAQPSPSQMDLALNAGALFFSYRGYYHMSDWETSNAYGLDNVNHLFNAVIITCDTGSFADYSEARSEAILRAGTPSAPVAGACAIGMSTASTHTQYNNILHGGIFHGLFSSGMHNMGQAIMAGKLFLYLGYNNVNSTSTQSFTQWCNLMGDPSMDIWHGEPMEMHAEFDSSIGMGQGYIDVTVTKENGEALEGAWVTARMDEDIFSTGLTDEAGRITLNLDPSITGSVDLTVTKPDYIPLLEDFSIASTGGVSFTQMVVDDDDAGASSGNSNGEPNSGETIELVIDLYNFSGSSATNVTAIISTDDPYIAITQNTDTFGSISAGNGAEGQSGYVFEIAADAPNMHNARFDLEIAEEGGNSWDSSFWMEIMGNDIDIESYTYEDGDDGVIEPGESSDLKITVKNNGETILQDVYGALSTNSYFLRVDDSLAYFGPITPGSVVNCESNMFNVTGLSLALPGMEVKASLRLFNDSGYEEIEHITLQVGNRGAGDPIGPDSYGYVCYDSGDTDYLEAPVYDWIEIDPSYGGTGTNTGINDNVDQGDDLVYVDLPFTFNFYGEEYSEVGICSNGWITFAQSEQVSFRNWFIPGALGPRAMVAAFWDELRTTPGGVFTWFNEEESYFVIEWSHNQNLQSSAEETFQIILYNPEAYLTPTYDGMIKIQYKTFNNVDSYNDNYSSQGNYCTVGIEDHTELRGLMYTYNDEYPSGAMELGNETAILFTGLPMSSQDSYLVYGNYTIHDADGSGYVDAGESIDLSIRIDNVGLSEATNNTGTIVTDSPYINITDANAQYADIQSTYGAYNLSYFSFDVLESCPNQYVAHFMLQLNNDDGYWEYPFTITVIKPSVTLSSTVVYDINGNNDGVLDPGEDAYLAISLENQSSSKAFDVMGELTVDNELITIEEAELSFGDLTPGMNMQKAYRLSIDSSVPAETNTEFALNVEMRGGNPQTFNIMATIGIWGAQTDFEESAWGFSSNDLWEWGTPSQGAHSGEKAWGTRLYANYMNNADWKLDSGLFYIGTSTELHFWHKYLTQTGSDGGNVKISIDGGNTWEVIEPEGGYPDDAIAFSNTGIGGEPAYTGYQTQWAEAVFNLMPYAGNYARLRWHFGSDGSTIAYGWTIDDVSITGSQEKGVVVSGTVTLSENAADVEDALVTVGSYSTRPNEDGDYILYTSEGTYDMLGSLQYFESDRIEGIEAVLGSASENNNLVLTYLQPVVTPASEVVDGRVNLSWEYAAPTHHAVRNQKGRKEMSREEFQNFRIYRQCETGPIHLIVDNLTENIYQDQIDSLKTYRYLIEVVYDAGSSVPVEIDGVYWDGTMSDHQPDAPVYANQLRGNFPNPFNPETRIEFSLKQAGKTSLKIYNIKGQLVKTMVNDHLAEGNHSIIWHGRDNNDKAVSSGLYLYRLETNGYDSTKKMLLLK